MDGYRYYKSSTHKQNRIYWYCRLRKPLDCKARVVMVDGVIAKGNLAHTHLPNQTVLGKWDLKRKLNSIKVKPMHQLAKPTPKRKAKSKQKKSSKSVKPSTSSAMVSINQYNYQCNDNNDAPSRSNSCSNNTDTPRYEGSLTYDDVGNPTISNNEITIKMEPCDDGY